MTSEQRILERERRRGRADALDLARRAPDMDGTALIAEEDKAPAWREDAVYTAAHIGCPVQDLGQVYTIRMAHTPAHNPGSRPKDLPAIYWRQNTSDPARAKEWMEPNGRSGVYIKGNCAVDAGRVWRSIFDGENVWRPSEAPQYWEDLGPCQPTAEGGDGRWI